MRALLASRKAARVRVRGEQVLGHHWTVSCSVLRPGMRSFRSRVRPSCPTVSSSFYIPITPTRVRCRSCRCSLPHLSTTGQSVPRLAPFTSLFEWWFRFCHQGTLYNCRQREGRTFLVRLRPCRPCSMCVAWLDRHHFVAMRVCAPRVYLVVVPCAACFLRVPLPLLVSCVEGTSFMVQSGVVIGAETEEGSICAAFLITVVDSLLA